MNPTVEKLENIPVCTLGEGPHWDAETQSLYFVDIIGKAIHKYMPATKKHTRAIIGTDEVSLIIPIKGEKDKFLISIGRELAVVTWDGDSEEVSNTEKILEVENHPDTIKNRWNDGKCDRSGRLWAGTMAFNPRQQQNNRGAFYSYHHKGITKHLTEIGISNGLAWSEDNRKMFYIDSITGCMESYDFDIVNGTIKNKQIIFTAVKHNFEGAGPDGMTIDSDGNIWVAIFNGHQILKIDSKTPEKILASIPMPAKQVTSLAFGGPNLDELYATSARINGMETASDEHGSTYRITGLNVKGYPGVPVKLPAEPSDILY